MSQTCELLNINSRSIKSWSEQQHNRSQEFVTLTEEATPSFAPAQNGVQLKILAPGGISASCPEIFPWRLLRRYFAPCTRSSPNDSSDLSNTLGVAETGGLANDLQVADDNLFVAAGNVGVVRLRSVKLSTNPNL